MKVYNQKALQENTDYCCINTKIKELAAQTTGEKTLNMKFFTMDSDGYSPLHSHPAQHRLIITDGRGVVFDGEKTTPIQAGDIVYITQNEPHQLKTTGKEPLKFICLTMET